MKERWRWKRRRGAEAGTREGGGGGRLLTCTWLNSQRSRGDQTRPDGHTQDTGR